MPETLQLRFDDFNETAANTRFSGRNRHDEFVELSYEADPTTVEVTISKPGCREPICKTINRADVRQFLGDLHIDPDRIEWEQYFPSGETLRIGDPRLRDLSRRRSVAGISAAVAAELLGLHETGLLKLETEYWRFRDEDVAYIEKIYALAEERRKSMH